MSIWQLGSFLMICLVHWLALHFQSFLSFRGSCKLQWNQAEPAHISHIVNWSIKTTNSQGLFCLHKTKEQSQSLGTQCASAFTFIIMAFISCFLYYGMFIFKIKNLQGCTNNVKVDNFSHLSEIYSPPSHHSVHFFVTHYYRKNLKDPFV